MAEDNDAVDLTAIIPTDTAILHIVAPGTSRRTGWDITMAGPGHPKTVALANSAMRERLERESRIESARVNGRKWKPEDREAEESRRDFVKSLVDRIVTWTPVKIGGVTYAFDAATAVDLFMRPEMGPFVSQVTDFVLDEKSFIPGSATN